MAPGVATPGVATPGVVATSMTGSVSWGTAVAVEDVAAPRACSMRLAAFSIMLTRTPAVS
jgi:hypothetical protein